MKQSVSLLDAVEFGRDGLDKKAIRVSVEKSERSKTFMQVAIGMAALAVGGVTVFGVYAVCNNHANDPEVLQNRKLAEEIKQEIAQKKVDSESKMAADKAMAKAREEAEIALIKQAEQDAIAAAAAKEADRTGKLLEKMFEGTKIEDAVCKPSNMVLKAKFDSKDELVSLEKKYEGKISPSGGEISSDEARAECIAYFSVNKFLAPRGLSSITSGAHYNQLKDMWAMCRGGFNQKDLSVDRNSDGSIELKFQMHAKDSSFSSVKDYKAYQKCMLNSLSLPKIAAPKDAPVSALQ